MNKNLVLLPGLFALGIAVGMAVMVSRSKDDSSEPAQTLPAQSASPAAAEHPMARSFAAAQRSDSERIQALENQLHLLGQRIDELERSSAERAAGDEDANPGTLVIDGHSNVDTPVSGVNPAVTTSNLVKAGVNPGIAADITRRRNEIDLRLLELRDRATREGYYGTDRYAREVAALRELSPSLRDEIGEESYDNYLFTTGQSNRVRVASVMMGSPAEAAGMQNGDLVVSYGDQTIFSWNELQAATATGERGEYVNVTVLRNGQLQNLWIPRGPLGVRLGTARVKP